MDRILELLARVADLTAEERTELSTLIAETLPTGDGATIDIDDEQLVEIHNALVAAFDAAREADAPDVTLLGELADAVETVRTEDAARQEASAEAQRAIDELAGRVHAQNDGEGEGDDGDQDDDGDATDEGEGDDPAADDTREPETVAASAGRPARPGRTPLAQLNRHRPRHTDPDASQDDGGLRQVLSASPGAPDRQSGATFTDLDDMAGSFAEAARRLASTHMPPGQRVHLARITTPHPEDRQLGDDARANMARIDTVRAAGVAGHRAAQRNGDGFESLVAAGGLCAPLEVRYEVETFGDDYRPIRDGLARFGAVRGGVRWIPGPVLADIGTGGSPGDTDAAISQWTMTNDEAADPDTPGTFKSIQRVDCDEEATAILYTVVKRLEVGNLMGLTYPERVRAFIDLAGVAYSRFAESLLWGRIVALSTAVTGFGNVLGSARDLLAEIDAAAWAVRNRNRVPQTTPLRVILPDVVIPHIRTDLARELPGSAQERLAVAQAEIDRFFDARAIAVTLSPDIVTAGAQSAGALAPLPESIPWSISLEGTFSFLEGPSLDLGFEAGTPIRDTHRNAVNDYELFAESTEQVAKFGSPQALVVTSTLVPTGATAGTVDVIPAS